MKKYFHPKVLGTILIAVLTIVGAMGKSSTLHGASRTLEKNVQKGGPLKFQLANGMTAILLEDHAAPVVAFQAWVGVGSADEGPATYGIAHVHEHMLFKGTKKRGVGGMAQEVEGSGGDINAWTSYDNTAYHLVLASRYFDTGLDILADALQNSQFDPKELEKELEVVLEEIRRGRDNPSRRIGEEIFTLSFQKHPYGRPVIGYEEVVEKFSRKQILEFYKRWYIPNNMTFVVVGDFDAKVAKTKIRKAFAQFKKGKLPRQNKVREPEQKEMRAKIVRQNIQETFVNFSFHIPDVRHPDGPALDLISMVLSHGESSRLTQRIKEDRGLVNRVSAYAYTPKDPGLFMGQLTLHHDKLEMALSETIKEVALLATQLVSPEELRRAKINVLSDAVYEKETVEGQARKLAYYQAVLGDLNFEKEYYSKIESLTAEDLRQVMSRYLAPDKISVALLLPEKALPHYKTSQLKKVVREGFRKAKEQSKKTLAKVNKVQVHRLKNGIKVILKENHAVNLVSVRAVSLGGLRYETPETNGLSQFVARVWTKATPGKSARDIAQTIESMAGSLEAVSGRNSLGLSMEILSQFSDEGMDLFSEVLRHPTFDSREVDIERRKILEAIRNLEDNLSGFVFKNFLNDLYGSHPYGMDSLGTKDKIESYTSDHLQEFYQRIVKPDNLVISVVGDVEASHVLDLLDQKLGDWKAEPFRNLASIPVQSVKKANWHEINRDKEQAHIVFGFLGTTLYSEDRYAMDVLDNVLSGMGGRLFMELRDRQSLAYSLTFFSQDGLDPGFIGVYIGTDPRKIEAATQGIRNELKRVTTEKISQDELKRAIKYIVGTFEIELQRNGSQSSSFSYNELYGLGWDAYEKYIKRIQKVTAEDVLRVAQKYIQLGKETVTLIRPALDNEKGVNEEMTQKSPESAQVGAP